MSINIALPYLVKYRLVSFSLFLAIGNVLVHSHNAGNVFFCISVSSGVAQPDYTGFKRTFNVFLFSKPMQFILRSNFSSSHIKLDFYSFLFCPFGCSNRLRRHPETEQTFYDFKFCSFDGAVIIFAPYFMP